MINRSFKNSAIAFCLLTFQTYLFTGCVLEPNHNLLIKNETGITLIDVQVGYTSYGTIKTGESTGFKPIEPGTFSITTNEFLTPYLIDEITIKGIGFKKWTLTIQPGYKTILTKD